MEKSGAEFVIWIKDLWAAGMQSKPGGNGWLTLFIDMCNYLWYRVFLKNCLFPQNSQYYAPPPWPAMGFVVRNKLYIDYFGQKVASP